MGEVNFLDYYNRETQKSMTEEERLALHKQHKQIPAKQLSESDDDFYDDPFEDDVDINEARRVPFKPKPRPAPVPQPRPAPKPVPRPAPIPVEPEEFYDEPAPTPKRHSKQVQQRPAPIEQNGWSSVPTKPLNPALEEAYNMMGEMNSKIEEMFYRYGMSGLEKLNECMVDVFEEILNPRPVVKEVYKTVQVPTQQEAVQQAPVTKPVTVKKKEVKTIVKKKPIVKTVSEKTVPAQPATIKKKVNPAVPTVNEKQAKETFDKLASNCDLSSLGDCLSEVETTNKKTSATLAQINANAAILEEKINKTKKQNAEPVVAEEEPIQQEDFEIVEDDATIDVTEETNNLEENTEN